jgi:hypothetical protein
LRNIFSVISTKERNLETLQLADSGFLVPLQGGTKHGGGAGKEGWLFGREFIKKRICSVKRRARAGALIANSYHVW